MTLRSNKSVQKMALALLAITLAGCPLAPMVSQTIIDRPAELGDVPSQAYGTNVQCLDNQAPQAYFTFEPITPTPGEEVTFDASESTDLDGDQLAYLWTVTCNSCEDPNSVVIAPDPDDKVTMTYRDFFIEPGHIQASLIGSGGFEQFTVTLRVTDECGSFDPAEAKVNVTQGTSLF